MGDGREGKVVRPVVLRTDGTLGGEVHGKGFRRERFEDVPLSFRKIRMEEENLLDSSLEDSV